MLRNPIRTSILVAALTPLSLAGVSAVEASSSYKLVVPAAAHAAGVGGSVWSTDLNFYNSSAFDITGRLTLIADGTTGSDGSPSAVVTIPAHRSIALVDAVGQTLGQTSASGALSFDFADSDLPKLAISSRTFNQSSEGTFGQTIPALSNAEGVAAGTVSVLFAPVDPVATRFNFGAFSLEDSVVTWRLVASDGTVLVEKKDLSVSRGTALKYNDGIHGYFGVEPTPGEVVEIEVRSGRMLPWASRVDNKTNDGDFSLARSVRGNEPPVIAGLDTNNDGSVDVKDLNGDLTLDQALAISSGAPFPYDMRLVASDPEGKPLSFTGLSLPSNVVIDSASGLMTVWPGVGLLQISGVRIQISDGIDTVIVTIPIAAY